MRDGYRRVFHTLLADLIPPFGSLHGVSLDSEAGGVDLAGSDLLASPEDLLPADFELDGNIDINVKVLTSSGELFRGLCIVSLMLDATSSCPDGEPDELRLSVYNVDWSVFCPADEHDRPEEAAQYEYNGPNLTKFLRSIVTAFDPDFLGGDDDRNMIADGFRLPLTYE